LVEAIRDRWRLVLADLHGANRAPAAQRHDPGQTPEPRHPMPATDEAFTVQKLPHLPSPICFPCLLMEDAHPRDQGLIGTSPQTI
jgi:hypothetical protein